jgi:hypothetical protein
VLILSDKDAAKTYEILRTKISVQWTDWLFCMID